MRSPVRCRWCGTCSVVASTSKCAPPPPHEDRYDDDHHPPLKPLYPARGADPAVAIGGGGCRIGFGLMKTYHADNEYCLLSDQAKGFRILRGVIERMEV